MAATSATSSRPTSRRSQGNPRPYDPGQPARVEPDPRRGAGCYLVESFRERNTWYSVNLSDLSCDCPHFTYRVRPEWVRGRQAFPCKHIGLALEVAEAEAYRVASRLTAEELVGRLEAGSYRPEVESGIRRALLEKVSRRGVVSGVRVVGADGAIRVVVPHESHREATREATHAKRAA